MKGSAKIFFVTAAVMLSLVSCTPGGGYGKYLEQEEKTNSQLVKEGIEYIKNVYDDTVTYDGKECMISSFIESGSECRTIEFISKKLNEKIKVKFTKTKMKTSDDDLNNINYEYWEKSSNYFTFIYENPLEEKYAAVLNDWFDEYKLFFDTKDAYVRAVKEDRNLTEEQFAAKYEKMMWPNFKLTVAVYYEDDDYESQTEAFLWDLRRRCLLDCAGAEENYLLDLNIYFVKEKQTLDELTAGDFIKEYLFKKAFGTERKNILEYWSMI